MPTYCPHGRLFDWGDFGPDPNDGSVGAESCAICEGKPPPALRDLVTAWPSEAVKVLLETGALEQVAWRFEVRQMPGADRPTYGFMSWIEGEAGHHHHERVYRLVNEENRG